ncbi:MAG TPA: transporter substrate-binding domain-containing protein [Micromonosporaceae bacterium]|nr:transporter substrate-binding domain-containing protein [Micromonosporaceae bacterium]
MITVIGIALAMRIGPPSRQQLMKDARLSDKSVLLVGVKDDVPGIALRDTAGRYTGFDIDIAYMVAADLGFRPDEVRFLPIEPEDRPKMQARDDNEFVTVDLVISTFSITKEREDLDLVSFSAPYLRTEQSVVTRKGHANVQTLEDLAGEKVCTLGTSTSQSEAAKAGAQLSGKNRLSECIDGLLRGAYAAVTTDAAMLAGFVAKYPNKLQHHDIGLAKEEAWGINTGGVEALRTLVNLSLYNSFHNPDDRRWEDAFNRHLREIQPVSLPQQVAVDEQPEVAEVKVRQWPWDTRKYLPPAEPGKRRR